MEWKTHQPGLTMLFVALMTSLLAACNDPSTHSPTPDLAATGTPLPAEQVVPDTHTPEAVEVTVPETQPVVAETTAAPSDVMNTRLTIAVVNDNQEPVSGALVDVLDSNRKLLFSGQADSFGLLYLVPALDFSGQQPSGRLSARAADPFNNQASKARLIPLGEDNLTLVLGDGLPISNLKQLFVMGEQTLMEQ